MDNKTIELLKRVYHALDWLIDECDTNYLFGEDKGELDALDNAKDRFAELSVLLDKISPET